MPTTLEPDTTRLAPALVRWCREAAPDARTTAIVRTRFSADLKRLSDALQAEGAVVQTAGAGGTTVVISCEGLRRISHLPDVLAIEPPRELFPKSGLRP